MNLSLFYSVNNNQKHLIDAFKNIKQAEAVFVPVWVKIHSAKKEFVILNAGEGFLHTQGRGCFAPLNMTSQPHRPAKKRGFSVLGTASKRRHTEKEWLLENRRKDTVSGWVFLVSSQFMAKKQTFMAKKSTFVAKKSTFVAKKRTFVAINRTFVGRKVPFHMHVKRSDHHHHAKSIVIRSWHH